MWSKDPGWNHKDSLQFLTTCGKTSAAHCFVLGVGKYQKLQSRGSSSTFLLGRLVLEGKLSLPALVWKAVLSMERFRFWGGVEGKTNHPPASDTVYILNSVQSVLLNFLMPSLPCATSYGLLLKFCSSQVVFRRWWSWALSSSASSLPVFSREFRSHLLLYVE